jgi:CBS domain containing-hemolysin-like protein
MTRQVKELMTGLSEIPVVDENSTLFEALLEIGVIHSRHPAGARLPAALVLDGERNVAGILEFRHMLKALEPRYADFVESAGKGGFSFDRIRSELQKYGLWGDALEGLCQKAGETTIKSLMTVPEEIQIADAESSINEAVYRMIVSGQDYLFVRDGRMLIGFISLSDIMGHICDTVKACRM